MNKYLSRKLAYIKRGKDSIKYYYAHWCPACNELHEFSVDQPNSNNARWSYNNNPNHPTFRPSMNITIGPYNSDDEETGRIDCCHYFLDDGKLFYLNDCTHVFRDKTMNLPNIPYSAWLSLGILPETLEEYTK